MFQTLEALSQWMAVATGFVAAWLWLRSAKPPTSTAFNITVTRPSPAPSNPPGATYVGQGHCQELNQLGNDLVQQSRLSAWAARITAFSVLLQALSILFHTI